MRKSQSQFVKYYSILPADPPRITQHPKDQSVATGADVSFRVEATGDDLTFQWQKNQSDLDDGDRCCGTRTSRLRIIEVEMNDEGRYRCFVKNSVGDEFSQEAFLSKLFICSSTLGSGLERMNMCKPPQQVSVVSFLQNSLLQCLVLSSQLVSCLTLWVPSIHLHSTCTVEVDGDIRHLIHFNLHLKVLEFAYSFLGAN